jgi:filamentous hemagglutinin family protein
MSSLCPVIAVFTAVRTFLWAGKARLQKRPNHNNHDYKSSATLLGLCLVPILSSLQTPAQAQIVRDRTLPQPSRIDRNGNVLEINGGTQRGQNLFHSFERFSVPEGGTAFFNNSAGIESIFSRITGRSASRINGTLRANGSANLFLLNPNGIIFGPNAALDIGGAFIGSTADQIRFGDGAVFSAVNPQATSLLTVSVPVGIQFGNQPSAPIQVQGAGHRLFLISPENPAVDRSNRPAGLAVDPGQTLALIGGELNLAGGNLTAAGGRIELGSVVAGEVELNPGWRLGYSGVEHGDISLTNSASLEASGNRGGAIQVQGRTIQITGTSAILADTLGSGAGGSLTLRATEQIRVAGFAFPAASNPFVSRLSTDVAAAATGQGGTVTITTPRLQISDGGQISSGTFGPGDAGNLRVQASELLISGGSPIGPSGLFAPVEASASGNGGRLVIDTERLQMTDGAQIAASTFGAGNAGSLTVRASQVELQDNNSGLFAIVEAGASGNGGTLALLANQVRISGNAQVATSTAGAGDAGNLIVRAEQIELDGARNQSASALVASVESEATGQGGNLTVTTEQLRVSGGAQISTTTFGDGRGGDLAIRAEEITVRGGTANNPSALVAASSNGGNSGNLLIETARLRLEDGGQIGTATAGDNNAGDLTINASESIEIFGRTRFGSSGLFASAIAGNGAGGNLTITTERLTVQDGATISVSNFSSADPNRTAGQGNVGNIAVNANQIKLDNGLLTADSAAGDRGNITLESNNILLTQQSAIRTNASGAARGGNIQVDTDILAAANNSDITANAENNFGGQVTIQSEAVLGTQIRPQLTPQSDITAFSELGADFSGTVQLNAPIVDPSRGLAELPEAPIDADSQIAAVCAATAGSEFIVTGRGGLPEAPTQTLRGGTFWEDLRTDGLEGRTEDEIQASANENNQSEVTVRSVIPVEAQGWKVSETGQVHLVSQTLAQSASPIVTPTIDCAAARRESDL